MAIYVKSQFLSYTLWRIIHGIMPTYIDGVVDYSEIDYRLKFCSYREMDETVAATRSRVWFRVKILNRPTISITDGESLLAVEDMMVDQEMYDLLAFFEGDPPPESLLGTAMVRIVPSKSAM